MFLPQELNLFGLRKVCVSGCCVGSSFVICISSSSTSTDSSLGTGTGSTSSNVIQYKLYEAVRCGSGDLLEKKFSCAFNQFTAFEVFDQFLII